MGRISTVDHIRRKNPTFVFLADALEQALGPAAFNANRNAGVSGLKVFCQLFGDGEIQRRVKRNPPFIARRADQFICDPGGAGGRGSQRLGKSARAQRGGGDGATSLQHASP
jgi:hypothetical protein